ncbi:MAG: DUF4872 domain-containing protein [Planctomycetes bacterium]|nr:DUF4872 domain-containing protein [Planctomycetota bacterium]
MTDQKTFKRRVRERMAKTGESYTTARRQLLPAGALDAGPSDAFPGLLPGCTRFGGVHGDSAVLCNAFAQAGIVSPHDGRPFSEAMLFGLCGGIGFMYFVFEYAGHAPILSFVPRHWSLSDEFSDGAFERTGVRVTRRTGGAPGPARKALDDALARGRTAICTVDPAKLPWLHVPAVWAGHGAHLVGVCGIDPSTDVAWIDDRARRPNPLSLDELAAARASYKKAKQRLVTVDGRDESHDLAGGIRAALAETTRVFHEGKVKGFESNFGFAGLAKWHAMLTGAKDRKSWRRVFATAPLVHFALRRTYECIAFETTPPAGGRPLYADFLEEAADVTGDDALREAAGLVRRSAVLWDEIAELALPDDDPVRARTKALLLGIGDALRQDGAAASDTVAAMRAEIPTLDARATLEPSDAHALFDAMGERVEAILALEREAFERLG